jgi:hypothetical protein
VNFTAAVTMVVSTMGATISTEQALAADILDPTTQAAITADITVADTTEAVVMVMVVAAVTAVAVTAAAVTAVAGITTDWRWPEALFRRTHMIRIAARVLNIDRFGGQYLVTVQLARERYTGTSDRFSFGAIKPHLPRIVPDGWTLPTKEI